MARRTPSSRRGRRPIGPATLERIGAAAEADQLDVSSRGSEWLLWEHVVSAGVRVPLKRLPPAVAHISARPAVPLHASTHSSTLPVRNRRFREGLVLVDALEAPAERARPDVLALRGIGGMRLGVAVRGLEVVAVGVLGRAVVAARDPPLGAARIRGVVVHRRPAPSLPHSRFPAHSQNPLASHQSTFTTGRLSSVEPGGHGTLSVSGV